MIKRIGMLLVPLVGLAMVGCATNETARAPSAHKMTPGPKGQFECADRNHNDYIDRAELVYLRQCGVGEDLQCGDVPEHVEDRPPSEDFEGGRRMLEVFDADGDARVSKLEFRAHCADTGWSN